jgi:hypothetical protein
LTERVQSFSCSGVEADEWTTIAVSSSLWHEMCATQGTWNIAILVDANHTTTSDNVKFVKGAV